MSIVNGPAAEPEPVTGFTLVPTPGIGFGNETFTSTFINDKCTHFDSYPTYTNYFFWISHGESTSSLNHLQETKNTLPRTTLFGHALQLTTSHMLENILQPSKQLDKSGLNVPIAHNLEWLLTCHESTLDYRSDYVAKKIKYKSRKTTYNVTNLPPLRFSVSPGYDQITKMSNGLRFIDIIGLYHYSTETQTFTKILNWVDLSQKKHWFYNDIFKALRETKKHGIDLDDAALGIYCCRATTEKYALEYGGNFSMTSHAHPIERNIIHEEISLITNENDLDEFDSISPFLIENNNTSGGWSALGERTDQGCGLNVLSYFGIIPQRDAREMAVCLTKGTSIVEICRYVNDYLRRRNIIRTFVIRRHTLNYALSTIMQTFVSLPFTGRWATFMKIYKNPQHEDMFNNRGHTFAFTVDKDDKGAYQIAFVDPQVGANTLIFPSPNAPVDDPTADEYIQMLENNIKEKYPFYSSDKTAADVIYIVDTSLNFEPRHHTTKEQFDQLHSNERLQPVTEANLFAEGTKKKKTRRRQKKKKKARRSRKYSEGKR